MTRIGIKIKAWSTINSAIIIIYSLFKLFPAISAFFKNRGSSELENILIVQSSLIKIEFSIILIFVGILSYFLLNGFGQLVDNTNEIVRHIREKKENEHK